MLTKQFNYNALDVQPDFLQFLLFLVDLISKGTVPNIVDRMSMSKDTFHNIVDRILLFV